MPSKRRWPIAAGRPWSTWCWRVQYLADSPVIRRVARHLDERRRALESSGVDTADAERRAFEELLGHPELPHLDWSRVYERYLTARTRRAHGVYFTPAPVVRAQVRLIDDALRRCVGCADGLASKDVDIIDPATGTGAYPLGIIEYLGNAEVARRMRLFEAMPGAVAVARAHGLPVEECNAMIQTPRLAAPVVVIVGNPPYRRHTSNGALDGFVREAQGIHLKNLYNEYVYFWRWALRVGCESRDGPAVVCFVTPGSFVRGPAFAGMRAALRRAFDSLWLIDLEGDNLAARASDNVFPIRTPVVIALGVRRGDSFSRCSAAVHYTRLRGSRERKLEELGELRAIDDLAWRTAPDNWDEPLAPRPHRQWASWPALTDLFPWQVSGAQLKRTWPIGTTPEVLRERWHYFLELAPDERVHAFGFTRDRNVDSTPSDLCHDGLRLAALRGLDAGSPPIEPQRYAYRSFDRQWVLPDARLGDFMRPRLWRMASSRQIFLTSLLTNVLGPGPAAVATAHVPDMDHFRGSFGARSVIPLWLDAAATRPNVSPAWLSTLSERLGIAVGPDELMCYCYALFGTRGYFARFEEELRTPGPRIPLTINAEMFRKGVALGVELLTIHTYRRIIVGEAGIDGPLGGDFPRDYAYDPTRSAITAEQWRIREVRPDMWDYAVSGYRVLESWLRRRIRPRRGRSVLDAIQPRAWTATLNQELLELIWLIEATLRLEPALDAFLTEVVSDSCVTGRARRC